MGKLQVKRIYEAPEETDGSRVLVDRLWPRGIKKEKAELTAWEKTIAPTNELRKAFGHDPEKFPAFAQKYEDELEKSPESGAFLEKIKSFLETGNVTLLYGAKDPEHNNAVVLKDWIEKKECCAMSAALFFDARNQSSTTSWIHSPMVWMSSRRALSRPWLVSSSTFL